MGFNVTNLSNNPLPLSDGKRIAPGESRKLETVGDREQNYASRNWLSIVEDAKEEPKTAVTNTNDGGKKQ